MYWSYFLPLPILFATRSEGINNGCTAIKCDVQCHGISQKELLLSVEFKNKDGDIELPYNSLTIVDSYFRHIEEFPTLEHNCIYGKQGYRNLIIRNSGIKRIEPEVLRNWVLLNTLDFSYNEIQNTKFLTPLEGVRYVNLSHNRIECFDMETFVMYGNIEQIDLSFNEIRKISNEKKISATSLNISHNHLTDVNSLMMNIRRIEIIDISYNQLREISTETFRSQLYLRYLNIGHNKLISINSEFFNFLTYYSYTDIKSCLIFIFSNNKLNNINIFFNNTKYSDVIYSLDYSDNDLKTINFVKPITKSIRIRSVKLSNNKISDLGGFNFTDTIINFLDLKDNNITYVDLKAFINIEQSLDLSNNRISCINSSHFTESMSLKKLNLSHNEIEKLNSSTFSVISSLEELDLSNCILKHLNEESFSNLSNLTFLNLSFNFIESLPEKIFVNLNLTYLDLSHNFLTLLPDNIFSGLNLQLIDLGFNQLHRFSENVFNNSTIGNFIARSNPIIEINEESFIGLKDLLSIDLSNAGIKELRSNTFEKLNRLNCIRLDDNEIQSLPVGLFRDQKNLTAISMTGNNLTDLNRDALSGLSGLLQLRTLNITLKGNLTQGMFRDLFNLYELNLVESEVTTIKNGSFSGLDMLKKFKFKNLKPPKIESGAFIGLSSLKTFNPRNWFGTLQSIESNQFEGLEKVEHLNLSHFGIETVNRNAFFGLISLESLNLTGNNINSLSTNAFNGLKSLSSLDLSHNRLKTVRVGLFSCLIHLKTLHLNHNNIRKIHAGMFTYLKKLNFLNLSNNNLQILRTYGLFLLEQLEVLDVNFNDIEVLDYNVNDVPAMKTIGIGSNRFGCDDLIVLLRNFRLRNVSYERISHLNAFEQNIDGISCFE